MNTLPALFSLAELSGRLGKGRSTVRRALAEAGVDAVRLRDGRNVQVDYRTEDIKKWLRSLGLDPSTILAGPPFRTRGTAATSAVGREMT